MLPIAVVDDAVLKALAGDTLRPAVARAIIDAVFEALQPNALTANVATLRSDLRALDKKIANLTEAIEEGGAAVAPLVQQLSTRQKEREGLLIALASAEAPLEHWRKLLTANVEDGRQLLREVLEGPLRFTPEQRTYRFEGDVATGRSVAGLVGVPPCVASLMPGSWNQIASWLQRIEGLRSVAWTLAGRGRNPYSSYMSPLRARVQKGRLVLDEPTTLPEGTVVDLVADDEGDDLTEDERRALHEALTASSESAEAGRLRPASAILDELRRRR
ncbi:MAG TPA: hypothetical protein VK886_08245 [Vicinamibacterales bacterium]|nr:hypothetical protein [Vicinamibacterales bacterium]